MKQIVQKFEHRCIALLSKLVSPQILCENPIYHYTNINSFCKIIENSNFLFTNYFSLNDPWEITYGIEVSKRIILNSKIPDKEVLVNLLHTLLNTSANNHYVCSFSEKPDNLSLWRLYGDDGFGVSIGIDRNFSYNLDDGLETPIIAHVSYGEEHLFNFLSPLLERISKITSSYPFKNISSLERQNTLVDLFVELSRCLIPIIISTKHESFRHEEEIRLIIVEGFLRKSLAFPEGYLIPNYRKTEIFKERQFFKINQNGTASLEQASSTKHCIFSKKLNPNYIKDIWMGPGCKEIDKINLYGFLEKMDLSWTKDLIIKQPNLPYC